jgi:peptide/nickel transport system ATP-binding protein
MLSALIKKIEIKNVKTVLENISFEINGGEVYTIAGKNGTGKTTLIKALTGLLPKDVYAVEGKINFDGIDLLNAGRQQLQSIRKNKIKYVFQDAVNSFDPLKTFKYYFENLSGDKNEIDKLMKFFILPGREKLYKLFPYEVSGGMAQRISFILALLSHPELIILDEPTSGIDAAIANLYLEKIKEFVSENDRSVLLVTHDLNFALNISTKIALLSQRGLSKFYLPHEFLNSLDDPHAKSLIESFKQLSL